MNTSITNIELNIPGLDDSYAVGHVQEQKLSNNNLKHIHNLLSYQYLEAGWDSYNADMPQSTAITKAITFIVKFLHPRSKEVFFTVPTPDGDILIELKYGTCRLEFFFTASTIQDSIVASCNEEFYAEEVLNETTLSTYLKWLYR